MDPPVRGTNGPVRGTDPLVTGIEGPLIVENAFHCNGCPYDFNDGRVFIRSWCWDPNFRDRHLRKISENFRLPAENQSQVWIHRKTRKIGVWESGAEIPTSAVDTRTAVLVSTPEKNFQNRSGKNSEFFSKV